MGRGFACGVLLCAAMWSGTAHAHGAFLVDTTADHDDGACQAAPEGDCTLREAILAANALINDHPEAPDTISFDFGPGATPPFRISLGSALPEVTEAVIIDGASEPRYILSREKAPVVVLQGAGIDSLLRVRSDRALIVSLGFDDAAVSAIDAEGADYLLVRGCYFGIDTETGEPTSLGLQPAFGAHALHVRDTFRARIGGLDDLSRNVIAGSGAQAVLIERTDELLLHNNYIGVDPNGAEARPNGLGGAPVFAVDIRSSESIEVYENVVSSNEGAGISLLDTPGAAVEDNRIGVDADGRNDLGNGGTGLLVSGNLDGLYVADNIISSNGGDGFACEGLADGQWVLLSNTIGVDVGQSQVLPNLGHGVAIGSGCEGVAIGTTGLGQANVIAHNQGAGIRLVDGKGSARGNQMFLNGELGIDAGPEGVTANDPDDQEMPINFPELREVIELETGLQISGCTFERAVVDVYEASSDPSGFGEGRRHLVSFTEGREADEDPSIGCSPENGSAFSFTFETDATAITLTATRRDDTSEFSPVYPQPDTEPEPDCEGDDACEPSAPICNVALGECQVCLDDAEDEDVDTGCTASEPRCESSGADVWSCVGNASSLDPDRRPEPPPTSGSARGCSALPVGGQGYPLGMLGLILMGVLLARRAIR